MGRIPRPQFDEIIIHDESEVIDVIDDDDHKGRTVSNGRGYDPNSNQSIRITRSSKHVHWAASDKGVTFNNDIPDDIRRLIRHNVQQYINMTDDER